MSKTVVLPPPPQCPRCGYDLSGIVAAWTAECPTTGTCSECGLGLEWRLILRPELTSLRWLVESPRPPRSPGSALRTCLHLTVPPRFWQKVTIEVPVRQPRLAAWLTLPLVLLATTHLVHCLESVARDLWQNGTWYFRPGSSNGVSRACSGAAEAVTWTSKGFVQTVGWGPAWLWCGVFAHAAFILVFACLPHTRARAKVRPELVVRNAAYGLNFVTVVLLYNAALTSLTAIMNLLADAVKVPSPSGRWWDHVCSLLNPTWNAMWNGWDSWCWSESAGALALTLASTAWVCWYWWYAMSRGLRMKEARAAYIACIVPTLLAVAIGALSHFTVSYGR